ncbi:MAG: phasin family protein [Alphaproteobacteria bacterium]|nr:phasin family protein [Alphaproteobacteria bacterium]
MAMMDAGQEMGRDANAFTAAFLNGPIVDALMRTTESYSKACLAWHEEILRFAAERLQRDSELGQALANTRNWADAAKLHQEWASSALRDYTNETTRLLEIAADVGSKIAQTSTNAASEAGHTATEAARATAEAAADTANDVQVRSETRAAEMPRPKGQRRSQPAE